MPVHVVARKYQIPRGSVQTLAQTCHGFAAGMIKFCERMGWGALAAALDHMSDRLKAGTSNTEPQYLYQCWIWTHMTRGSLGSPSTRPGDIHQESDSSSILGKRLQDSGCYCGSKTSRPCANPLGCKLSS